MKRYFLIGYMGAGKTTLGKFISQKMELSFIDLDLYIESRYRKTINEIFQEKGEDGFREIERKALHEVGEFEDVVIATGGGVPCFFDNKEYMNQQGVTIYLKTGVPVLFKRLKIAKASRPILKDKTDEELYSFIEENLNKRESAYEAAKLIFDANELDDYKQIEAATNKLCSLLKDYD
ncbi:MAG: shikimate kinase [Bacteroidales bacterium]|nr:shikimate kinase [Bacteroidales bacterium]